MPTFSSISNQIMNAFMPTFGGYIAQISQRDTPTGTARNLSRYIAPVQLARIRQDIQSWRDCAGEFENSWYPHRVKLQRLYLDTKLNGHVSACQSRRLDLTTLKDWKIVDKDDPEKEYPKIHTLLAKPWFKSYMRYALESKAYGYSLISLGDLVNDDFPNLSMIRRFNISPDRHNVTQFIYSISGAPFLEDPWTKWHIWVPSPTDDGVSTCGYGYLYKAAFYEIIARNVITQNVDATELYGMPIRVGKTSKAAESEERAVFEAAIENMGSAGWMLMDLAGDELELVESKSLGNGYKIYESLETRCEKKISKIILGHADAMDSIPGRLGAAAINPDSPVNQALRDIATTDMNDFTDLTNLQLFPKLRGLGFIIPDNCQFVFDNNEETAEVRTKEDTANLTTAQIFQTIKNAGGDPDWKYFSDRTGIKTEKLIVPVPPILPKLPNDKGGLGTKPIDKDIQARIDQLYKVENTTNAKSS